MRVCVCVDAVESMETMAKDKIVAGDEGRVVVYYADQGSAIAMGDSVGCLWVN